MVIQKKGKICYMKKGPQKQLFVTKSTHWKNYSMNLQGLTFMDFFLIIRMKIMSVLFSNDM